MIVSGFIYKRICLWYRRRLCITCFSFFLVLKVSSPHLFCLESLSNAQSADSSAVRGCGSLRSLRFLVLIFMYFVSLFQIALRVSLGNRVDYQEISVLGRGLVCGRYGGDFKHRLYRFGDCMDLLWLALIRLEIQPWLQLNKCIIFL